MLDLELLKTFVCVVDEGSFTRAADRVHRPQREGRDQPEQQVQHRSLPSVGGEDTRGRFSGGRMRRTRPIPYNGDFAELTDNLRGDGKGKAFCAAFAKSAKASRPFQRLSASLTGEGTGCNAPP